MKGLAIFLIIFISSIVLLVFGAATTPQTTVLTQPAKPKFVLVEKVRSMYYVENDIKDAIDKRVREGWILKTISITTDESRSKGVIVFEKY